MLKIKDNIDMKILEQYGFKKHEYIQDIDIEEWLDDHWIDDYGNRVEAPPLNREEVDRTSYELITKTNKGAPIYSFINVFANEYEKRRELSEEFDLDVLFELINDGLVEKI